MTYRIGCVMEQTIGHVTHHQNLATWMSGPAAADEVSATWIPVPWAVTDLWNVVPGIHNTWTLRGSLRAREGLKRELRRNRFDALLFHTQAISLFSVRMMQHTPSVITLDATPYNLDTVVHTFGSHPPGDGIAGKVKHALTHRALHAAAALAPWNRWARESLVRDYGIDPAKIEVIHAGVNLDTWRPAAETKPSTTGRRLRLLFVGADFRRKGGDVLLAAFADGAGGLSRDCELDVVTAATADVQPGANVRVHRGLEANSDALRRLFADADVLVLPTLGDCMPLVVTEAMASGLPVIATNVGAIDEQVDDGETGLLIPPNNPAALVAAIESIRRDDARRRSMGAAGRRRAEAEFCDHANFRRLLDLVKRCVAEREGCREGCRNGRRHGSGRVVRAARDGGVDANVQPSLSNKMS